MMIHKRFLVGLIIFIISLLVACEGGNATPPTLTFEQTLSATQTAVALQEELAVAMQATQQAINTQQVNAQLTQQAINNATATQQVIARSTQQAINNATATQQAIINANATATYRADLGFVFHNQDWQSIEQDFGGVTMVLVPPGCFMMGTNDVYRDERPVHEQCFDEPFWIDKYEVTNKQFADFGGVVGRNGTWTGDDLPRESITWFEARDFCEQKRGEIREFRLPTEREWEYAARGPNNLVYPWGNEFVADDVVDVGNNNNRPAPVGSREGGVSWVGAMDMSGNVWEWASSLYEPYEYDADDGRERDTGNDTTVRRVLRGGSWDGFDFFVRASDRFWNHPSGEYNNVGFRCSRSYDS